MDGQREKLFMQFEAGSSKILSEAGDIFQLTSEA
jgi:hypothetical protein